MTAPTPQCTEAQTESEIPVGVDVDDRLAGGWIRLYRRIFAGESFFAKDHFRLALWLWLVSSAAHMDHYVTLGDEKIFLRRGQMIFGGRKAAEKLGVAHSRVERAMRFFQEVERNIGRETKRRYSIVTIVNYDVYNPPRANSETQTETQVKRKRNASETQVKTYNKGEEGGEGEEVKELEKEKKAFQNKFQNLTAPHPITPKNGCIERNRLHEMLRTFYDGIAGRYNCRVHWPAAEKSAEWIDKAVELNVTPQEVRRAFELLTLKIEGDEAQRVRMAGPQFIPAYEFFDKVKFIRDTGGVYENTSGR